MSTPIILTIGHSTRTLEDLIGLLQAHGVQLIIDIRTIPRSRRNPQFNEETLPASLKKSGIDYVRLKELGGLRHPRKDSQNKGWRNESFRGFADYMQTPEFEAGIIELIGLAQHRSVAMMCAEALPWRCHRSLIADALLVRGMQVEHILTLKKRTEHSMTRWAKVDGKQITYPEVPIWPTLTCNSSVVEWKDSSGRKGRSHLSCVDAGNILKSLRHLKQSSESTLMSSLQLDEIKQRQCAQWDAAAPGWKKWERQFIHNLQPLTDMLVRNAGLHGEVSLSN